MAGDCVGGSQTTYASGIVVERGGYMGLVLCSP